MDSIKKLGKRGAETVCPECKRSPASEDHGVYPFCSPRCKSVDLGRWLREEYRIPVQDPLSELDGIDELLSDLDSEG